MVYALSLRVFDIYLEKIKNVIHKKIIANTNLIFSFILYSNIINSFTITQNKNSIKHCLNILFILGSLYSLFS